MITNKDMPIYSPLNNVNEKLNIQDLLLNKINYTEKKIIINDTDDNNNNDNIISRNVNVILKQNTQTSYTHLINDCATTNKKPNIKKDEYYDIIIKRKEEGQSEEENIENLIKNIKIKMDNVQQQILTTKLNWQVVWSSLPNTNDYDIEDEDLKFIEDINKKLQPYIDDDTKELHL